MRKIEILTKPEQVAFDSPPNLSPTKQTTKKILGWNHSKIQKLKFKNPAPQNLSRYF